MNNAKEDDLRLGHDRGNTVTGLLEGTRVSIGAGFSARSFRAQDVGPAMDPLVLVDDYVMSEDTFGEHPHAGLSAVSLILSDSQGGYQSRDSLGNDLDLRPGDLYWLEAGRGVLHHELPRQRSTIHGLQIFVNVPRASRFDEPSALLVRRRDMPVLKSDAHCVHVVLGSSNGLTGARSPGLPMTLLDGAMTPSGNFRHTLECGRNAWVHAVDGAMDVAVSNTRTRLRKGQAIAVANALGCAPLTVHLHARGDAVAQFVLLDGQAVRESFVQKGPFVLNTVDEFEAVERAFRDGQFGSIG